MIVVSRHHDFSAGHRVVGHENKCANLHGHNYRVTFTCTNAENTEKVDSVGRVVDFDVIKTKLCQWLEDNWDHKFLIWEHDPYIGLLYNAKYAPMIPGLWTVPFNPTAENMAVYLHDLAFTLLKGTGVRCCSIIVEETRKCRAQVLR